jgi:hypothetical protein
VTLALKVGSPEDGAHWHSADVNEVRFASVNDEREEVIWVETRQKDGTVRRYENRRPPVGVTGREQGRTFDCVDCHNRASHIYEAPEDVVDRGIVRGEIDRAALPFARREALAALTAEYGNADEAARGIESRLHWSTTGRARESTRRVGRPSPGRPATWRPRGGATSIRP